ncbi:MAG: 50S ribosomal protein L25/general stress protein Ctc [Rickettsiales bacterium]|jgi:large subunit ribosomal protein L25|nr:50S ribosomal protein L25/general stress protein Ctc [Rickettsiales bacterium]
MSEIIKLDGNIRTNIGGSSAKKLRREGRLPAVIYSNDAKENICIDIDLKSFEKEQEKGNITTKIFEVRTPKKTFNLVISEIDYDPLSDRPRHIDFISLEGKKEVKIMAPVIFLNRDKSPGLKKNGFLNILKRKIQLLCDIKKIPSRIEIDVGDLRLKQAVKSSQITLPNGAKFVSKKDFMIVNITGRGKADDDPKEGAAAKAATTAPTGGAAVAATTAPTAVKTATATKAATPKTAPKKK